MFGSVDCISIDISLKHHLFEGAQSHVLSSLQATDVVRMMHAGDLATTKAVQDQVCESPHEVALLLA